MLEAVNSDKNYIHTSPTRTVSPHCGLSHGPKWLQALSTLFSFIISHQEGTGEPLIVNSCP